MPYLFVAIKICNYLHWRDNLLVGFSFFIKKRSCFSHCFCWWCMHTCRQDRSNRCGRNHGTQSLRLAVSSMSRRRLDRSSVLCEIRSQGCLVWWFGTTYGHGTSMGWERNSKAHHTRLELTFSSREWINNMETLNFSKDLDLYHCFYLRLTWRYYSRFRIESHYGYTLVYCY